MKLRVLAVPLLSMMLAVAAPAAAQQIDELSQLSFGSFAVAANDAQYAITVTPDNDVFMDSRIVGGEGARRGEYRLTGFPQNVSFYLGVDLPNPPAEGGIVLDDVDPASRGGGPSFYLDDLAIANGGVLQTDHLGDVMLYIGGTLRTSGTGQRYDGGTYTGSYAITIYY